MSPVPTLPRGNAVSDALRQYGTRIAETRHALSLQHLIFVGLRSVIELAEIR